TDHATHQCRVPEKYSCGRVAARRLRRVIGAVPPARLDHCGTQGRERMSRIYQALKNAEQGRAPIESANDAKPNDSLLAEIFQGDGAERSAIGMVPPLELESESPIPHHLRLDELRRHCERPVWKLH